MTHEEILKGNRLIAEFMGWDRTEPVNSTLFEQSIKYAAYHRSWDWLIPVVEKIEEFDGYSVQIEGCLCAVRDIVEDIIVQNNNCTTIKIEAVWNGVVRFIEWYNQQNK